MIIQFMDVKEGISLALTTMSTKGKLEKSKFIPIVIIICSVRNFKNNAI